MVAINFSVFVDEVEDGRKLQTIRRKARCKPGDRLQLYTGQRTNACRLLREAVCVLVDYCEIRPDYITFGNAGLHPCAEQFALNDGFKNYHEMVHWFQQKYGVIVFAGEVIQWRLV